MKEFHDTDDPWPHLEFERSKVKVTRPISAVTENHPYLRKRKTYELQTWYTSTMTRITDIRGDLQAESTTCRGRGILCRPHYTGRTDFLPVMSVCWFICPACCGMACKRMHISSKFFDHLVWNHSSYLSPSAVTKFQGNPRHCSVGGKCTGWGRFAIFDRHRRLSMR